MKLKMHTRNTLCTTILMLRSVLKRCVLIVLSGEKCIFVSPLENRLIENRKVISSLHLNTCTEV